jgi:hypothetical protein
MVAAIIGAIASAGIVLLIWRPKRRSKDQKLSTEWESEGDTSFVSKTTEPPAQKPDATREEFRNQPPPK